MTVTYRGRSFEVHTEADISALVAQLRAELPQDANAGLRRDEGVADRGQSMGPDQPLAECTDVVIAFSASAMETQVVRR